MRAVVLLLGALFVPHAHAGTEPPHIASYFAEQRKALAAYEQRDVDAMRAAAQAMLAANPGHPPARYMLAAANALAGRGDDALAALEALADLGLVQQPRREPAFARLLDDPRFVAVEARFAENAKPRGEVRVVLEAKDLPGDFIPEAFARDEAGKRTLFASVRQRRIAAVSDDGAVSDFVPTGRDGLMSALGIHIVGDEVLVASSGMAEMRPGDAAAAGSAGIFAFDRVSGALRGKWLLPKPAEGRGLAFGDLLVSARGRVIATDSVGGGLYVLDRESGAWASVPAGGLGSPQGLAELGEERYAIADYTTGIWILDDGRLAPLASEKPTALYGIDGLYAYRGDLIATQNGTNPQRILRLRLDRERKHILRVETLASAHPKWDEITLGEVVGDEFRFIANSHWSKFDAKGELPPAKELSPPTIMAVGLGD